MIKLKKILNEVDAEFEEVDDVAANIFDAIIAFRKTLYRSKWKKHRKINALIKELLKIDSKLGNIVNDLE